MHPAAACTPTTAVHGVLAPAKGKDNQPQTNSAYLCRHTLQGEKKEQRQNKMTRFDKFHYLKRYSRNLVSRDRLKFTWFFLHVSSASTCSKKRQGWPVRSIASCCILRRTLASQTQTNRCQKVNKQFYHTRSKCQEENMTNSRHLPSNANPQLTKDNPFYLFTTTLIYRHM
ncbi:unnamed protein product [Ectocarpus sp. 4 AP-2014]